MYEYRKQHSLSTSLLLAWHVNVTGERQHQSSGTVAVTRGPSSRNCRLTSNCTSLFTLNYRELQIATAYNHHYISLGLLLFISPSYNKAFVRVFETVLRERLAVCIGQDASVNKQAERVLQLSIDALCSTFLCIFLLHLSFLVFCFVLFIFCST